jgi:hypothetical protein
MVSGGDHQHNFINNTAKVSISGTQLDLECRICFLFFHQVQFTINSAFSLVLIIMPAKICWKSSQKSTALYVPTSYDTN